MSTLTVPEVGARVSFREGTPQFAKNQGITYVVEESPNGEPFSIDRTKGDPLVYVWLVAASDLGKSRSRQRRRTGYASALELAPEHALDVTSDAPEFCACGAAFVNGINLSAMKRGHMEATA